MPGAKRPLRFIYFRDFCIALHGFATFAKQLTSIRRIIIISGGVQLIGLNPKTNEQKHRSNTNQTAQNWHKCSNERYGLNSERFASKLDAPTETAPHTSTCVHTHFLHHKALLLTPFQFPQTGSPMDLFHFLKEPILFT